MMTVALVGEKGAGRVALVDDEDYETVIVRRWRLYEYRGNGRRICGPYALTTIRRNGYLSTTLMHTLLTGWPLTDHIDHDGLNNQRSNLRPATKTQNQHNRRSALGSSSKYKGVFWNKVKRRWQADITVNGTERWLGYFVNENEAALAYNAAARSAFGSYACLNEIDEMPA